MGREGIGGIFCQKIVLGGLDKGWEGKGRDWGNFMLTANCVRGIG